MDREKLMKKLRDQVLKNQRMKDGPVLASGMSEYDGDTDSMVSEIFDRADRKMYENKQSLKGL